MGLDLDGSSLGGDKLTESLGDHGLGKSGEGSRAAVQARGSPTSSHSLGCESSADEGCDNPFVLENFVTSSACDVSLLSDLTQFWKEDLVQENKASPN